MLPLLKDILNWFVLDKGLLMGDPKISVKSLEIENIHNDRLKFNGVGVYT